MIGDSNGDSGSNEITTEKGDGGFGSTVITTEKGEGGLAGNVLESGGSLERKSEGADIRLRRISYPAALVNGASVLDQNPSFVVKDGVAEVAIPEEVFADVEPLWRCFVVGYFMNDAPHIGSIHATVYRIWNPPGKKSKIDVQFIGKTTVLFRMEDAAVRNQILTMKFWNIFEVPLMLGEWTPETARYPPDLSAMPLWVDL